MHGFGFAGALSAIGLPADSRVPALLLFNLGVEAGQFLVLAVLVPSLWWLRRAWPHQHARAEVGASIVLASAAMFWLWQRLLG